MTGMETKQHSSNGFCRNTETSKVHNVASNDDLIREAAYISQSPSAQANNEIVAENLDTARRYDEVLEIGEDHESLEDEVLEFVPDQQQIVQVGPPKNIDLQAVQLEDKNIEKPEGSQFEKQSVKSENV